MFSRLGAINQHPLKTEIEKHGKIEIQIDFYQIENKYNYAIKAIIASQVFSRYPHPNDLLYDSIFDARTAAYNALKTFCINNKLKKQFNYCTCIQPTLFDCDN